MYMVPLQMDNFLNKYMMAINGSRALAYIGANTGQELAYCKMVADHIYAFEPITHPSVWQPLIAQADSKTEIFDVALSDTEGTELIYPANNNYASSSLLKPEFVETEFPYLQFGQPIQIRTKRFDSYSFADQVDVLIIDVQGAEYKVLQGISNYSNIRLVVLEYTVCPKQHNLYTDFGTFDQLYRKLHDNGLEFCETYGTHFNPYTRVVHSNAIFMRF